MPKGGNLDRKNMNTVVEIVAKPALIYHLLKVAVCRRHHAKVHVYGSTAAKSLEFMLLESSQKFRLKLYWKVCNFVEKQSSFVRLFETPEILSNGSGKRASLMTEKLALQQSRGNGSAVGGDKIVIASRTQLMNSPGDQFFSGAGFAEDEHC